MSKALAGTSLLMVDDDPDGLALLEFVVELAGATVRSATNARDALETLTSFKPDVMLLDISLPEMDGYDLLKAIRRDPAMRNVPALAVTAHAYERDKQRASEAGFSHPRVEALRCRGAGLPGREPPTQGRHRGRSSVAP